MAVLIDTNLLCLLVVGNISRDVAQHKRLRKYTTADYETVRHIILSFGKLIVCPHVLAECSNLIRQTNEPMKTKVGLSLQNIIFASAEENCVSSTAISQNEYLRLGLTDAVLIALNTPDRILLSDDLDLCLAAQYRRHRTINYNHLRDGVPLDQLGTF